MVTHDDVDAESLQAQIDLSMSFAHDLVTSWIRPCHLARLGSGGTDAAQALEDELRRPARLGVGASLPVAPSLAREAAKLKRKLGKDGEKTQGTVGPHPQGSSKSDDEEHKGRPAKRKTSVDPFGPQASKKKRKADSGVKPSVANDAACSVSPLNNSSVVEPTVHNSFPTKDGQQTWSGPGDQRPAVASSSGALRETSAPAPARAITAEFSRVHTSAMLTPDDAKLLGVRLLNLDGPPDLADKPGNNNELNGSKRRRKRRKKKKRKLVAGTGDKSR